MQDRTSRAMPLLTSFLALVVAAVGIGIAWTRPTQSAAPVGADAAKTALARIKAEKVIHAGYGIFPPYTMLDPTAPAGTSRVRGFAVDLLEEIARRCDPPIRVEWHKINWETLRADLASDRIDILADALYQTVPLALDFGLSEPFSYFGIGCALVRKDDDRFKSFTDLDRPDITIAVAVGWLSTDFAKKHLSTPTFKDVVVAESPNVQLDEVLNGRADVAIQDVPTVLAYARAHPDKVKALWVESPPAVVVGGFATRKRDSELLDFIDTGLRILRADGTIEALDQKWGGMGYYDVPRLVPGRGLTGNGRPHPDP